MIGLPTVGCFESFFICFLQMRLGTGVEVPPPPPGDLAMNLWQIEFPMSNPEFSITGGPSGTPRPGPPRLPFVVGVGVTGHRAKALKADAVEGLRARIRETLLLASDSGVAVRGTCDTCFDGAPTTLRLVSPIADGADQIAADVALELGWQLQVVLPFDRATYRSNLANNAARREFDRLAGLATCVLELPGGGGPDHDAYVMAGRATVAHCDMLIAVWDGRPARGRGGTAEIVQLALTRGTAVVHIAPDNGHETRLVWSGFDPNVLTLADEPGVARPLDGEHMGRVLTGLLLPPPDKEETAFIHRFQSERLRRIRTRVEYPLMLALAGVKSFGAKDFHEKHCAEQIRAEWQRYCAGCVDAHSMSAPIALLENAYSWSDRLATHFAQTYRSGHIFSFVLGGIAVCIGLSAFMAPAYKFEFAGLELLITFAIILNAWVGTRNQWHRRWLDYRQLAERLRPMRSLKLLGIAAPDPPGTATNPVPLRWIDWYAAGIWRGIGCPSGALDREGAARLAASIAEHEIAPQVTYHRRHAEQIELLDKRLESIGFNLFLATLIVSIATMAGMLANAAFVNDYGNWLTLVSAGFPALGTAVFGIRFQADFGGDALRSLATANTLATIDEEMHNHVTLPRAADLTEQAARVMLSDLDEWRLVNQQRDLSVG